MNTPVSTYTILIVVDGKVRNIGNFNSTRPPIEEEVKLLAKENGYEHYTDWIANLIDDGREF